MKYQDYLQKCWLLPTCSIILIDRRPANQFFFLTYFFMPLSVEVVVIKFPWCCQNFEIQFNNLPTEYLGIDLDIANCRRCFAYFSFITITDPLRLDTKMHFLFWFFSFSPHCTTYLVFSVLVSILEKKAASTL